jgi:hypothetical protein
MSKFIMLMCGATLLSGMMIVDVPEADAKRRYIAPVSGACQKQLNSVKRAKGSWHAYAEGRADHRGKNCGTTRFAKSRSAAVNGALANCRSAERAPPPVGKRGTCRVTFVK